MWLGPLTPPCAPPPDVVVCVYILGDGCGCVHRSALGRFSHFFFFISFVCVRTYVPELWQPMANTQTHSSSGSSVSALLLYCTQGHTQYTWGYNI
jgi:hypothetical protein